MPNLGYLGSDNKDKKRPIRYVIENDVPDRLESTPYSNAMSISNPLIHLAFRQEHAAAAIVPQPLFEC